MPTRGTWIACRRAHRRGQEHAGGPGGAPHRGAPRARSASATTPSSSASTGPAASSPLGLPDGGGVPHAAGRPGARDRRAALDAGQLGGDGLRPAAEPHLRSRSPSTPLEFCPLRASCTTASSARCPAPTGSSASTPTSAPSCGASARRAREMESGIAPDVPPQALRGGLPQRWRETPPGPGAVDRHLASCPSRATSWRAPTALDAVMHSLEDDTRAALFGRTG
jgi:hypothetical protein